MSEFAAIEESFLQPAQAREADKSLYVRFFVEPLPDEDASALAGRPIFRDADMIEIRVRGDRNNIVIREAGEHDKVRFRAAYKEFKEEARKLSSGTPLSQWPAMSRSFVEELKFLGFFTVEDVAGASELSLSKVNGLRSFQERAKLYLEAAAGQAPITKLQADNEKLHQQSEEQAALIRTLQEQIDELRSSKPKK